MSALDDILAKDAGEIDVLEWAVILMPKEKADEAAEKLAALQETVEQLKAEAVDDGNTIRELRFENEVAEKALRSVAHDRPTAHTDEVWQQVLSALSILENK